MKNGSRPRLRSVSRQSMMNIATTVLSAIAMFEVERRRRVGDDRLDAADVVREAALDLAGLRLGEEAQRHPLEVGVERRAQVLHDALADDVVEVALADADQARDDRQRDHQPDEQVEQAPVALRDRVVDEELQQDRVDQAEEAREQDRDEDDRDLARTAGRTRRSGGSSGRAARVGTGAIVAPAHHAGRRGPRPWKAP